MQALPNPTELLIGALAFVRVSAIMFSLPLIGDSPTPVRARILASVAITAGLIPVLPTSWYASVGLDMLSFVNLLIRELTIGLIFGFAARMLFDGLIMAAGVVSYQMGFGTGMLFMPDFGGQMDSYTAFHRIVVMLIFLVLSMHHIFIAGIFESFKLIPAGGLAFNGPLAVMLLDISSGIFVIAIQLSAPILVAVLFTTAALGLIARTVPQMNVFTLSFPANFFIGLLVYIATLPFFPEWMREHFYTGKDQLFATLKAMGTL
jgi:flagellar biosynthetic protein FliR